MSLSMLYILFFFLIESYIEKYYRKNIKKCSSLPMPSKLDQTSSTFYIKKNSKYFPRKGSKNKIRRYESYFSLFHPTETTSEFFYL